MSLAAGTYTVHAGTGDVFTGGFDIGTNLLDASNFAMTGAVTANVTNYRSTATDPAENPRTVFDINSVFNGTVVVGVPTGQTRYLRINTANATGSTCAISVSGGGNLVLTTQTRPTATPTATEQTVTNMAMLNAAGFTIASGQTNVSFETVVIPAVVPVADQPTQFMVDLTAVPIGAQWALWPGLTRIGNPLVSGVRDASTVIAYSTADPPPAGFVSAQNIAGDWVIGYCSNVHQATYFPFNVPENTLQTDVPQVTTTITPLAPSDQTDNITLSANLTNNNGDTRTITVAEALNTDRIEFDVENCPVFDPPNEGSTQLMLANARGASQFYLRNLRAILDADFTVGTVVRRDVMQFTGGAVNVRFGDYIFSDVVESGQGTGLQEVAGVYDTLGDTFTPRATERESRNITVVGQDTDTPHVISSLRRIGLTPDVTLEQIEEALRLTRTNGVLDAGSYPLVYNIRNQ